MSVRHPGYNHSSFALGYRLARVLPRAVCRGIGGTLGFAGYLQNKRSRTAMRGNLRQITGINGTRLDRVCRSNFLNFGRMLGDYFFCAANQGEAIRPLLRKWHGMEHLHAAQKAGQGVILVTAHLGNWELGGTLLALDGWPINIVTLEEPTGELTRMRDAYRRRLGIKTIAVGSDSFSFVEMIAALRRNEIVCMLVDRPYGTTGLPVEFFDRLAAFSSAPALLWRHTGAAVIPAFVVHEKTGGYHAFAQEPIDMETCAAGRREELLQNTQRVASTFEAIIGQYPEQWFNYVPIWKTAAPTPHCAGAL